MKVKILPPSPSGDSNTRFLRLANSGINKPGYKSHLVPETPGKEREREAIWGTKVNLRIKAGQMHQGKGMHPLGSKEQESKETEP
jgi:hypothetical protein